MTKEICKLVTLKSIGLLKMKIGYAKCNNFFSILALPFVLAMCIVDMRYTSVVSHTSHICAFCPLYFML